MCEKLLKSKQCFFQISRFGSNGYHILKNVKSNLGMIWIFLKFLGKNNFTTS